MSHGLSLSLPLWLSLNSIARVETALDVAKLAISLNQVPRFNRCSAGRTGSGFHITCAGSGSLRNSSFFMITHTGRLIVSGLGDRLENDGGHILQGTLVFTPLGIPLIGQFIPGG